MGDGVARTRILSSVKAGLLGYGGPGHWPEGHLPSDEEFNTMKVLVEVERDFLGWLRAKILALEPMADAMCLRFCTVPRERRDS